MLCIGKLMNNIVCYLLGYVIFPTPFSSGFGSWDICILPTSVTLALSSQTWSLDMLKLQLPECSVIGPPSFQLVGNSRSSRIRILI